MLSTSGAVNTPTFGIDDDASVSCTTSTSNYYGIESVPVPGKTYMIRDFDTDRAIIMKEEHLSLKPVSGTTGRWHKHCVERAGGWLGFREAVSGNYLGRDGKGGFQAKFKHFIGWESFCLRPLEEGGYHLLALDDSSLQRMGVASDGDKLIGAKTVAEATRWVFVKL
ncbi:hypothetical protein RRF57_013079 [Xylaria bambusicola]|uniref:Uncharacterized protein n=1 Tax=Xylaria bambusicola TaxID=326684 RepID=A0AAN7ZBF2_9PEZI